MPPAGPDQLRVTSSLGIPLEEVEVRATTSGGPGGQHANRSQTRVEVRFDAAASPSLSAWQRDRIVARLGPVVRAGASEERSQARNRSVALVRLATRLAEALHVEPPRRPTRPTRGSVTRRLDDKRRQAERKAGRQAPPGD